MSHQTPQRTIRILALALGILLLAWLPFEDTGLHWVLLFAAALSVLISTRLLILRLPKNQKEIIFVHIVAGGLAGLLITPAALLLMAFKSGIHGHGAPDFTPGQVQSVLALTPGWVFAGLLAGLGFSLTRLARQL